jgi:hypothetical protein
MYSNTAQNALRGIIGWTQPIEPNELSITLDPSNVESTLGKYFDGFHTLATPENVAYCIRQDQISNPDLNAKLLQMKEDAVKEVLRKIFDTNPLAKYAELQGVQSINWASSYDTLISENLAVFEEAIGHSMASRCLQLFLNSPRSNETETRIGMTYGLMKIELDGLRNEYGRMIGDGTIAKMEAAITNAINVLFPTIKGAGIGAQPDKPTLTGRRPW